MKKIITCLTLLALALPVAAQEYTSREEVLKDLVIDRDFQIQGEYLGKIGDTECGSNIIARGDGKFDLVFYIGGLPGAGWKKGDMRIFGKIAYKNGELEVTLTETQQGDEGRKPVEGDGKNPFMVKYERGVITLPGENPASGKKIERKSPTLGQAPPEGAIILFDGKSEGYLQNGKKNEEAGTMWAEFTSKPLENRPYRLHAEFMLSYMPKATGQARSNSGIYYFESYETQILDSFGCEGKDNECGGIYTVAKPMLNMCYPPLQWQTYDTEFVPPTFDDEGKMLTPAKFLSVKLNGVTIIENVERGEATFAHKPSKAEPRGIYFQGHGNKVQYRNLWVEYLD